MSPAASFPFLALAVAATAAAPSPTPPTPTPSALEQVVQLLAANRCDDAFELLAKVEAPSPPAATHLQASRSLAKGARDCRASDPAVALAFSALATRLAPGDAEIAAAHAEGLLALGDEPAAAALLDALIAVQPAKQAPSAWLLRAKMALEIGDLERAMELLGPLVAEPTTAKLAQPLLEGAREGQAKRKELVFPPPAPKAAEKAAPAPAPKARRHQPGETVAVLPGLIGVRGSQVLFAQLARGQIYEFRASGRCTRTPTTRYTTCGEAVRVMPPDSRASVFGLDFRVQFGNAEGSRPLAVGVGEDEESRVEFVADADLVRIRVFDDSTEEAAEQVSCSVSGFSVVAR